MTLSGDLAAAMASANADAMLVPGSILLGRYRIEERIAVGGIGVVVRARSLGLPDTVAIKVMRADIQRDAEQIERFLREARSASQLRSENVARLRDVGTLEDGRPYIVMEHLEGLDLGQLLQRDHVFTVPHAVDLVLQAIDAIAEAHALGIVHRDIKPSNLFITHRQDGSELLKVVDFGISKAAQSAFELSLTQTRSVLGTPNYMSPEQMRSARTVDPRSDIWALGVVLYQLVEGRVPFPAETFPELCVLVATEPPAPLRTAPALADIIAKCLAKPLAERYQDVGDLAIALEGFASDPARAHKQVHRILRVLGKLGRDSRDSMPVLAPPAAPVRASAPSLPVLAPPAPVARDVVLEQTRARMNRTSDVVILAAMFAIGIVAGLLYVYR